MIYAFKQPEFDFSNVFTMKYLCIASGVAVIISFILGFIEKSLEINIRVDKK